jgi:methionyl aminopeptidase
VFAGLPFLSSMIPIKNEREIDMMRDACRAAAEVLDRLETLVTPGMTTRDIDEACAQFIAEAGAKSAFLGYRKFPGQLCVSVNEEVVHGIGGDRRLAFGDIVKDRKSVV